MDEVLTSGFMEMIVFELMFDGGREGGRIPVVPTSVPVCVVVPANMLSGACFILS